MVQSVELEPAEWQQVITALAMTHPVLVKISTQLSAQQQAQRKSGPEMDIRGVPVGNSHKEPHHGL